MNSQQSLNQIMRQISHVQPRFCDKCGREHLPTDLAIVDQSDQRMVCKLNCTNCKNTYLIHVHNSAEGMVAKRANIKSEISHEEYQKFANLDAIDSEEILDVFMALDEIESIQDLENLLSE